MTLLPHEAARGHSEDLRAVVVRVGFRPAQDLQTYSGATASPAVLRVLKRAGSAHRPPARCFMAKRTQSGERAAPGGAQRHVRTAPQPACMQRTMLRSQWTRCIASEACKVRHATCTTKPSPRSVAWQHAACKHAMRHTTHGMECAVRSQKTNTASPPYRPHRAGQTDSGGAGSRGCARSVGDGCCGQRYSV